MSELNRFWKSRLSNGGADQLMRRLDYGHQQLYLPLAAKWDLNLLRSDNIVEFGCGPCGLAPWFQKALKAGVEPWANEFMTHGIDYRKLGYVTVSAQTAQEYWTELSKYDESSRIRYDLAICCNALDHDPDPRGMLDAIAQCADELFICYDLRHKATEMHPGITKHGLMLPAPWKLKERQTLSMKKYPGMMKEVSGRLCQYWSNH
jgi:hypothetical protein